MVPLVEGFTTHSKVMHHVGGMEDRICRDEVGAKSGLEFGSSAEMDRICGKGCLLLVFSPFAGRGAHTKVCQAGGNTGLFIWKCGSIKEEIVFQGCPEGIRFGGGSIERFWGSAHYPSGTGTLLGSHNRWWRRRRRRCGWWWTRR